jgi:hypothetical protein
MRRQSQFSLRAALVATTLCCFAVAGFAYANVFWASAWFSCVIAWLFCGGLGSIYSRGSMRAFWLGSCFAGVAYLTAVYGPVLDRRVGFWLITTKAMAAVQLQLEETRASQDVWLFQATTREGVSMLNELLDGETVGRLPQWSSFQLIGHSIFALLFAWCGGLFAARLYEMNRTGPE